MAFNCLDLVINNDLREVRLCTGDTKAGCLVGSMDWTVAGAGQKGLAFLRQQLRQVLGSESN